VHDRVTLTGWVNEEQKQALYQACDIYVVPSRLEGFGLTALEAMATGKPVVSTMIGAAQDGLVDESSGGVAEEATSDVLASAIERCIARMARDDQVGERNRDRMAELTWEQAGRRTKALYDELVAAARRETQGSRARGA
jgi:glycosyltransferase involved in cell wall biosynthesis